MRFLLLFVVFLAAAATSAEGFQPSDTQPAVTQADSGVDALLLQAPKSREDDAARIRLATERLETLRPTTQPTTQPTSQPADDPAARLVEARNALYREWEQYLAQIQRIAALRDAAKTLQSEDHLRELTSSIEDLKRKTDAVRQSPPPTGSPDEHLAQLTAEHQEADAKRATLSDLQSRRAALLATGFKQQVDALEADLKNLRQARQQAPSAAIPAPVPTAPDQELQSLERRRLHVQIAREEAAIVAISLESAQTEIARKQDEQYLEALQGYVTVVRERRNTLAETKRTDTLDDLARRRDAATSPHEIAWLDLRFFSERLILTYFKDRTLLTAIKERFPQDALDRLTDRIAMSAATWDETAASIAQRSGQEAMQLRQDVRQELAAYESELATYEHKLGETVSELQRLRRVRDQGTQRFRELSQVLDASLASAEPAERSRLETELTTLRTSSLDTIKDTMTDVQELAARLRDATELTDKHIAALSELDWSLHQAMLTRRESGLIGLDWAAVVREWRELVDVDEATSGTSAKAAADGLFPAAPDASEQIRIGLRRYVADLQSASGRFRGLLFSLLVIGGIGGALLTLLARKRVRRLAATLSDAARDADRHEEGWNAANRIHLLGWTLLRDVAPPVAIGLACAAAFWGGGVAADTRTPILSLLGLLVGAYVLIMLIRALFEPRERFESVLPCSNLVARHYRYWLTVGAVYSALLLVAPLVLLVLDAAPAIRSLFWEFFKTGVLLILLLFLVRKARVLGENRDEHRGWLGALLSALYPLVFLSILALLVMQVIGYGVLVEFIMRGTLISFAILVVLGIVVEYLCDIVDRVPSAKPAGADAAGPSRAAHMLRLVKLLLRLAGIGVAAYFVLASWGIAVNGSSINKSVLGLSAMVVVIALLVDRIIFSALYSLYVSGRMPQSTTNIIRRWVRGLLTLITVLFIIAFAGYEIADLWTFLATMMAMIAVGFIAVWSVLSNILSTLIILIWRPFNVGEEIDIQPEGIKGEVVDINFMYTVLKTEDDDRTTVPNSLFMQKFICRKKTRRKPRRTLAEQLEASKPLDE